MKCLVIAEAGVNHNANYDIAIRLIDAAVDSGADVVKFQTAIPSHVVTDKAKMAAYQIKNTGITESQLEMTRKIHLPLEAFVGLSEYCKTREIAFATTAFDMVSLEFINKLEMPFNKIPSGEVTNLPYIRRIGEIGLPVILSTGMCSLIEIEAAIEVLMKAGLNRSMITVLHCTSTYPAPFTDLNLKAISTIKEKFNVAVGYSDHSLGIEIPIAAVALGATVIEKHLTLDKSMPGPDHIASIEPHEFKQMVEAIRNIESSLGDGDKRPVDSELKNVEIVRRSIVAKSTIQKGEMFSEVNLACKRPATGMSPMFWDSLIGKVSTKDYSADDLIEEEL
jgi:N,N'-diacetyllegionaminate synthase